MITKVQGMKGKIFFREKSGIEFILAGVEMTLDVQNKLEHLKEAHRHGLGILALIEKFTFSGSFEAIRFKDIKCGNGEIRTIRFARACKEEHD